MPRQSTSAAEDVVANLHRRASELEQRIGKNLVAEAMKKQPWVIPKLVSTVESLGLVEKDQSGRRKIKDCGGSAGASALAMSFQAAARKSRKQPELPAPSPSKNELDMPPIEGDDMIPTKYWTLDALSPAAVTGNWLCVAEPATLSVANLKQITKKGQSLQNHQSIHRLLEYVSGLPGDFSLTGLYRSWAKLQELILDRNERRGRRCRDLALPVDFDIVGLYSLQYPPGAQQATIVHNFTKERVVFDSRSLPEHESSSDLFVSNNWSELRAAISSKGDPSRREDVLLIKHFPNQEVPAQRLGRTKRLALEDGDLALTETPTKPAQQQKQQQKEESISKKRARSASAGGQKFIADLAKKAKKGKR